jgi:hypothetical protein
MTTIDPGPLKVGSTGLPVDFLRRRFDGQSATTDLPYDAALAARVAAFQSANGLAADGVYGSITNAAMTRTTPGQVAEIASSIGVEPIAFRTMLAVETSGAGFYGNGLPKILLERHYVYRYANAVQRGALPPTLCYPTPGGYQGGLAEWDRFQQVAAVCGQDIAVQSCSWGLGQIMGAYWKNLGMASVADFLDANGRSELGQLLVLKYYLTAVNPPALTALRSKDWAAFARAYNGPANVDVYSQKLIKAYNQLTAI